MSNKKISQLPIYTGDPSGFDVPGVTNEGTQKANLGTLIQQGISADTSKASAQIVQTLLQRVDTVEDNLNKAGNIVDQVKENTEKLSELYTTMNGGDFEKGILDSVVTKEYDNKSIDCGFVLGRRYKVIINTDKVCSISIRYSLVSPTAPVTIYNFNDNIGEAAFEWECSGENVSDKLFFVPRYGESYPIKLTATVYEVAESSIVEKVESVVSNVSKIKDSLDPMTALDKVVGEATQNYYIGRNGLETNQYTANYKVTQYKLNAGRKYLIKIVDPNLYASDRGVRMYGFSDEGGVENKSLEGMVRYDSGQETEVPVEFSTDKYLFTCDKASLTDNNFELFEYGGLRPIDKYIEDKIGEIKDVFKDELDTLADFVVPAIKIQIPDIVFATVGTELNIYNDGITMSMDRGLASPMNYHTQWSCNFGRVHSRGIVFNPTANDVGEHSCTCDIYILSGKLIDSKTFLIKVVVPTMTAAKNILFVGDSLGTSTFDQIVADFNNTDKYSGSIKPNLYNFSKGGWHWGTYAQEGIIYQRVQVSGIGSLAVGANYVDSANNLFELLEVNITGGSGNVLLAKTSKESYGYNDLTIPSGTLTKIGTSYGGDSTFNYFNGTNEAGNPFWNASKGALDITKFRSDMGISGKFDLVVFQLGINSNGSINTEGRVEGWIESIYNAFLSDNPNTLFVLGCTPTATNDYSAIGSSYGVDSKTWGIRYAANEYKIKDLYLRWGQDSAGHPNMRVIGQHINIDRWYGYPISTRPVNSNTNATEEYHTNYVHPSAVGYKQLADAIFASIIGLIGI